MPYYRAQRLWNQLVKVCVPPALAVVAWSMFFGGRALAGELAGCYLVTILAGRALAAERARRATPARLERVRGQVDRVCTSLSEEHIPA